MGWVSRHMTGPELLSKAVSQRQRGRSDRTRRSCGVHVMQAARDEICHRISQHAITTILRSIRTYLVTTTTEYHTYCNTTTRLRRWLAMAQIWSRRIGRGSTQSTAGQDVIDWAVHESQCSRLRAESSKAQDQRAVAVHLLVNRFVPGSGRRTQGTASLLSSNFLVSSTLLSASKAAAACGLAQTLKETLFVWPPRVNVGQRHDCRP